MSSTITLPTKDQQRLPSLAWVVSSAPITHMPIDAITASRNGYGDSDLDGLTASIQAKGILQPLIVTAEGRLLAGRRRLEAARRARLAVVPVRVCQVSDERAAIEISLIENVERADLDPLTRAQSYRGLIEQGSTIEEIAALVGQGSGHVYQYLQLLNLHPKVHQALHHRTLSFANARALAPLGPDDQAAVLNEICAAAKPLTSRQVKARVDARRVMRLVQKPDHQEKTDGNGSRGNYAALFETEDTGQATANVAIEADPLGQLNTMIAEMIATAQGEDQVRAWARRLSHILEQFQIMCGEAESNGKSAGELQERLL